MKINFSLNKEASAFKGNIKEIYETALKEVGISENILVNVALVSAEKIKNLNKEYRGVDRVTDVLSFPMIDNFSNIENEADFFTGVCNIGDIYINLERAKEQAEEYGHSLKREFCFLALHGFLHLLGFDHMEKDEEKEMFELQNIVMQKVNIGRE